eukprot:9524432-Lingulodinium_polyedra.AAC.1
MYARLFHHPALQQQRPLPLPYASQVILDAGVRLDPLHQCHGGAFLRRTKGFVQGLRRCVS